MKHFNELKKEVHNRVVAGPDNEEQMVCVWRLLRWEGGSKDCSSYVGYFLDPRAESRAGPDFSEARGEPKKVAQ